MRWVTLVAMLACGPALADTLAGTVMNVIDGDTLVVQDAANKKHTVRLAEIDAPERRQPFWRESAVSLARLCFKKEAKVEWNERDAKKRVVGYVTCDGKEANAEQLRRGMAWGSPKGWHQGTRSSGSCWRTRRSTTCCSGNWGSFPWS